MYKAKVTSKGQITIPSEVRDCLDLKPGEKLLFLPGDAGEFRIRRMSSIQDLFGCLQGFDLPTTNAELNDLVAAQAAASDSGTLSNARTASDSEAA